jgi:hypothetical protein
MSSTGSKIGQAVFQRIVQRDRAYLQWRFLTLLGQGPLSDSLSLCGGAALHRVYVTRLSPGLCRANDDLDFHAPYSLAIHLAKNGSGAWFGKPKTGEAGELQINDTGVPGAFLVSASGTVATVVQTGIDLYARRRELSIPMEEIIPGVSGATIRLRVQSLSEILVTKIASLFHRKRPADVYDIWCGLACQSKGRTELRALLCSSGWHGGQFPLARPFHVDATLNRVAEFQHDWDGFREVQGANTPNFTEIYNDLEAALSRLSA